MTTIEEANRQDMEDKRHIDALRWAIRDFLAVSPSRVSQADLDALENIQARLDRRSAHIVAVWD